MLDHSFSNPFYSSETENNSLLQYQLASIPSLAHDTNSMQNPSNFPHPDFVQPFLPMNYYYPLVPCTQEVPHQQDIPRRYQARKLSPRSSEFFPKKNREREDNRIDIEKVKRGEDKRTTLMVRNIPNGFTREVFVRIINKKCKNRYDFLYLPMDQKTHCNMGYGYINMIDLESVVLLYENFNDYKWPHTRSEKVCSICYGRLQSDTEDLIEYCSDWSVMTAEEKYHPLFFSKKVIRDGDEEIVEMVPVKPQIDLSMRKN
ncbi:protein MEI2-like 1 [Blastocystis sp. subtype 4]|uniref:protein MEI2-like 1 n=1 Tax=Blastocystis sp. subtype 4 TaxID=944170 RepID=UPI000711E8DC|nr:protein MEI2-like 1 [Blastocystis sp. subtype 4]KNB44446.1 protein MEI2-like 1 [Blastocystis sp. subtype 4]|eukprot:XP_014527882.1 protein MEI2-like 1 [Blastocystis sp. subtype 4]